MPQLPQEIFESLYGAWAPRSPEDAAILFAGLGVPWWAVGGRALEAFTGVSRHHDDIDLEVMRSALPALRDHIDGRRHVWAAWQGGIHPLLPDAPDELPDGCGQVGPRENAASHPSSTSS